MSKNKKKYGILIFLLASLLYYFSIDIIFFLGMQNLIQYDLSLYQGKTLCLAFSADSKFLASGGEPSNFKNIQVWSTSDKRLVKMVYGTNNIPIILLSKNGKKIITYEHGTHVIIRDDNSTYYLCSEFVKGMSLSHDEKLLAVGESHSLIGDTRIFFMDSKTKSIRRRWNQRIRIASFPQFICQGKILVCYRNQTIVFMDIETCRILKKIKYPLQITSVSENGKYILGFFCSKDRECPNFIQLWFIEKNKKIKDFSGYLSCFSRDSQFLALAHSDHTIGIYSIITGEIVQRFAGHSGKIYAMCFSPNGQWLASSGEDKKIQLWDTVLPVNNQEYLRMKQKNKAVGDNLNNDYNEGDFSDIKEIKCDKEHVPYFIRALKSSDEEIRQIAAEALAEIGPDAKDAVPTLAQNLKDEDFFVLYSTLKAITHIGVLTAEILESLIDLERYDDSIWDNFPDFFDHFSLDFLNDIRIELYQKNSRIMDQIFIEAVEFGKNKAVQYLIEKQINANMKNSADETALIIASRKGYLKIVKMLLHANADVNTKNSQGETALMMAIDERHIKIIKLLLKAKADVNIQDKNGKTALMIASEYIYNSKVIKLLLEAKADVNIQDKNGKTSLMIASEKAYEVKVIQALLEAKTNANIQDNNGKTALMIALENDNDIEIIKLLCENGVDINITDNNGKTALMIALENNIDAEIIKLLLKAKANVNIQDKNGKTALIIASEHAYGHYNGEYNNSSYTIRLLLKAKADANIQDNIGKTALMIASEKLNYIRGLLKAKADVNIKDDIGKATLMIDSEKCYSEIVKFLTEATKEK